MSWQHLGHVVLFAAHALPIPPSVCAIGEVSLSGDVRRVPWISRRLAEAGRLGFRTVLVPAAHSGEALPPGLVLGADVTGQR